jgi:ATP-dependent Clp protease ATP-binding subunit ClpC
LLTSNVGAEIIKRQGTIGFTQTSDEMNYEKMKERLLDEAKRTFKPEFLNRLDDVIVFRALSRSDLIKILDLEIAKLSQRLKAKNLRLELDEKARDFLLEKGYDPTYGARPMRRAVERYLEDPLAEELLKGELHPNDPVKVGLDKDQLTFSQKPVAAGALTSAASA